MKCPLEGWLYEITPARKFFQSDLGSGRIWCWYPGLLLQLIWFYQQLIFSAALSALNMHDLLNVLNRIAETFEIPGFSTSQLSVRQSFPYDLLKTCDMAFHHG